MGHLVVRLSRSTWPAWLVTAAALIGGGPLFLRMPPWADLTLYDVAARNLLAGGVHYRDVFDTNLPGFVWTLTLIRAVVGPSWEAIRAVDLVVVASIAGLLATLLDRPETGSAARVWFLAGVALFYPFTPEINHCQRDVWMLLPAAGATLLRVRRLARGAPLTLRAGLLEGAIWGLAVWVKPHVLVPCAVVWLATVRRGWLVDAIGYIGGGLSIGAIGVGYLLISGTWPAFVEVFTIWNHDYFGRTLDEFWFRVPLELVYFPPWTYLHLVAIPLAIWRVVGGDGACRALAALYLGWFLQGLILQRHIPYVHVPEVLLMLAVLTTARLPVVPLLIVWFALLPVLVDPPKPSSGQGAQPVKHTGWRTRHPLTDPARMNHWLECWKSLPPSEAARRMDDLSLVYQFHGMVSWAELEEVADFLRRQGVQNGELLCWDDSPHVLNLRLGLRPLFRFQHVHQIQGNDPASGERVDAELAAILPRVKWAVGDLWFLGMIVPEWVGDWRAAGPDRLPPGLHPDLRTTFPFDRPAVFRSAGGHGRYVVYRVR